MMFRVGRTVGNIWEWSGGYAMTIPNPASWTGGTQQCCAGHATPQQAKEHGLARLVETASVIADDDVSAWADRTDPTGTAAGGEDVDYPCGADCTADCHNRTTPACVEDA